MNWLKVNVFFIATGAIAAGSLWLLGFVMFFLDLRPDDHQALFGLGAIGCLLLTYYTSKWLHSRLSR
jgi:hypothetical protein